MSGTTSASAKEHSPRLPHAPPNLAAPPPVCHWLNAATLLVKQKKGMASGVPFFVFPSLAANFSWSGLEKDPKTFLPLPKLANELLQFAPRSYNYPLMCENSFFLFSFFCISLAVKLISAQLNGRDCRLTDCCCFFWHL